MVHSVYQLDDQKRNEVVQHLVQKLVDLYVFPEVAVQMKAAILQRFQNGEYDSLNSPDEFCKALTTHLQEVSKDKHIRVQLYKEPQQPEPSDEDKMREYEQEAMHNNFGFYRVERLAGNIGYIDMRAFIYPDTCNGRAGQTAIHTMNFVAHTNALIFDLRKSRGGSPDMVSLLLSYLFDGPTHINSFYFRENDHTQQYWTSSFVSGLRYGVQKPVYVLTSNRTFSAGEEFTYDLQNLKRATIVGEVTGGGAHPGRFQDLKYNYQVFIPTGRAINPITQTNWEGTGVQPDIITTEDEAYHVAYAEALKKVLENVERDKNKKLYTEIEEALQFSQSNVT